MIPRVLEGHLALVTGAAQGNGLGIARGLGQAGASVFLTDVQAERVLESAAMLRDEGIEAEGHHLDVTDPGEATELAATLGARGKKISILVNNAGVLFRTGLGDADGPEVWRKTLDINLTGAFNVSYAFLPALKETKGAILNICSITSFLGHRNGAYAASKGGLKQLTQSQAFEFAEFGIRANAIAPGIIDTDINSDLRSNPAALKRWMPRLPMGRTGRPDELAGAAVFLCSDMAAYITGVTLPVDGGLLAV
ncbi:SDR family NAD(P)-dependent oxidoreductase [Rhizobium aquaticum]